MIIILISIGKMGMDKILVTGANGQLGSELRELFSAKSINNVLFTDQAELDITCKDAVLSFLKSNNISIIINCAAYTAVDKAEDEPVICKAVNSLAPGILADASDALGIFLIHISTDYVFDGKGPVPYKEDHPAAPAGVYGMTKLWGEQAVAKSGANYIIIRTSWLYSVYGNNFAKTILRLTQERESLNVVFDQVGTPTYAADLAAIIENIVNRIMHSLKNGVKPEVPSGIYHFSNEGVCSWFDFATEIVKLSGSNCRVHPVTSDLFPAKAKRPSYSVLDKTRIKGMTALEIPYWRDSLKLFFNKLQKLNK